jgi:hypothetical protein
MHRQNYVCGKPEMHVSWKSQCYPVYPMWKPSYGNRYWNTDVERKEIEKKLSKSVSNVNKCQCKNENTDYYKVVEYVPVPVPVPVVRPKTSYVRAPTRTTSTSSRVVVETTVEHQPTTQVHTIQHVERPSSSYYQYGLRPVDSRPKSSYPVYKETVCQDRYYYPSSHHDQERWVEVLEEY